MGLTVAAANVDGPPAPPPPPQTIGGALLDNHHGSTNLGEQVRLLPPTPRSPPLRCRVARGNFTFLGF